MNLLHSQELGIEPPTTCLRDESTYHSRQPARLKKTSLQSCNKEVTAASESCKFREDDYRNKVDKVRVHANVDDEEKYKVLFHTRCALNQLIKVCKRVPYLEFNGDYFCV